MTVYFIGAGPGAPDLITVRGLKLIESCPVCLYAGSLVPKAVIEAAPKGAKIMDTASMVLEDIMAEIKLAHEQGQDVARVHSGDPSIYGAIAEQMRVLDSHGIPYEVCPGVSAYAALAARLKCELTLPEICQSVILTRTAVRASNMPEGETLENFAATGAVLAIHLSVNNLANVVKKLTPFYGADCPVVVGYRVSYPDEVIVSSTLSDIRKAVKAHGFTRTALILVGRSLDQAQDFQASHLYDANHTHVLRGE